MKRRRWQVFTARLLFLSFVLFTSSYCLLAYIPFTYQQVHVGQLLPWLTRLVHLHAVLFWPALAAAVFTILPDLKGGPSRYLARAFVLSGVLVGSALIIHPLLPNLTNDVSSLRWCLLSLAPLLWLASIDWVHGYAYLTWHQGPHADGSRLFLTCLQTSVYLATIYFALGAFRAFHAKSLNLEGAQQPGLLLWSLISHLLLFILAFVVFDFVGGLARLLPERWQTRAAAIGSMAVVATFMAVALRYVVFPPLAFSGIPTVLVSAAPSIGLVGFASGVAIRLWDSRHDFNHGDLDLLLVPFGPLRSAPQGVASLALVALALLGWALSTRASRLDWEFLLQKIAVMFVWTIAFAIFHTITPKVKGIGRVVAYSSGAAILACYMGLRPTQPSAPEARAASEMNTALEEYSGFDISFRLVDEVLRPQQDTQADESRDSFYAFLAQNTHIPRSVRLQPVDVRLVNKLTPSPGRKPHIFFFVIDSLRRDYLAPYNSAVTFTPALDDLAHDSVVFNNAFTHYGGTGLSEPSIWVGGLMLHQQYMTPFGPMNSLQKLLEANHYHELISNDSILQQVVPPSPNIAGLDEHIGTMSYDLCRTLQELTGRLSSTSATGDPIFVYTQAQNIHVSVVDREGRSIPPGATFPPEFDAPYASRVQALDACLGKFVNTLKQNGMYDDSMIVITSDHGDSLGELGRWGHAYTIFPEIVRIPLLIHLPAWLRDGVKTDPAAVTFLTDLTPSLYYLLGEKPVLNNPLFGRPLFTASLEEQKPYLRTSYLLASSYAPVYGLLTHNGHLLYIADGVNFRDYAYELYPDGTSRDVPIADGQRSDTRNLLREQVNAIAKFYGLH